MTEISDFRKMVDVSTQVNTYAETIHVDWDRHMTPHYSREDIKEQYCITSRQFHAVKKHTSGFFGCLTSRNVSSCSSAKPSLLSACVRSAPSDENICDAPYPRCNMPIMLHQPYSDYTRSISQYYYDNLVYEPCIYPRRSKSFYVLPDISRYNCLPSEKQLTRIVRPRSIFLTNQAPHNLVSQSSQMHKSKHVSFARQYDISFENSISPYPQRELMQERLIDSQPVTFGLLTSSGKPKPCCSSFSERPIQFVEKSRRGFMKAQATQTDILPFNLRHRILPIQLSPRTVQRVKMVSQGAQTNGFKVNRRLMKSYSEADRFETSVGIMMKEENEREPLLRSQSEESPRTPYVIDTHSISSPYMNAIINGQSEENSIDISRQGKRRSILIDDDEILIDFKPAPVSPNIRTLINQITRPYRRIFPLQKTLSDGEIKAYRQELMGENAEPSYPHTCKRNHPHFLTKSAHKPVKCLSTPGDLSLLRLSTVYDHTEEEFHENLIHRRSFGKHTTSFKNSLRGYSMDDLLSSRSLPNSPTLSTRECGRSIPSFFTSTDSICNNVLRDYSDGIWNESQATILQVESIGVQTPCSKRRHILLLQHQEKPSPDARIFDIKHVMDNSLKYIVHTDHTFAPISTRKNSGGHINTDRSETSTSIDYIPHSIINKTGILPDASSTPNDIPNSPCKLLMSIRPYKLSEIAVYSSIESASSTCSILRNESVIAEGTFSSAIIKEHETQSFTQLLRSPSGSSSSSSSGSYDLQEPNIFETCTNPSVDGTITHNNTQRNERHHSSSGYDESPTDVASRDGAKENAQEQIFNLNHCLEVEDDSKSVIDLTMNMTDENIQLGHRQKLRKSLFSRHSNRNNRKKDPTSTQLQNQSPHIKKLDTQTEDGGPSQTSDESSCSHHYYIKKNSFHAEMNTEASYGTRHRRFRESIRRKSGSAHLSKRRSNEDKNAELTGSLPRRKSRQQEAFSPIWLSPGKHHRSVHHNHQANLNLKAYKSIVKKKALSAESLRSGSPGSDSVFYSEGTEQDLVLTPNPVYLQQSSQRNKEIYEENIVQPPAGFADSPEGSHTTFKYLSNRLMTKIDNKKFRAEHGNARKCNNGCRRNREVRAKSEERISSRSQISNGNDSVKRLKTRSTDVSMEVIGREDEDSYVEPYTSGEWIYIENIEESQASKRKHDFKETSKDAISGATETLGSPESTCSERNFRNKYEAAIKRLIHRKSSSEMYKRIQMKSFESDKRVTIRRDAGGEFGFRIHSSKPVVVSAIEAETPAENSTLKVGDIIISVNGRNVMDATHSEVVRLAHSGPDILELEVAKASTAHEQKSSPQRIKFDDPIISGYLWRKTANLKAGQQWVKRWFVLRQDHCLYYYKTDTATRPVGAVMLINCMVEQVRGKRPYSFDIRKQGSELVHLAADSEESGTRWANVIQQTTEKHIHSRTWLDISLKLQFIPAYLIKRPDCMGYLYKQHGRVGKTSSPTAWSRRFCVLKDAALYFYDHTDSACAFGVAYLHGFRVMVNASYSGGRKHAFELLPPDSTQRSYIFCSDTEMDKRRWLAAMEYSIDRWIKVS